VGGAISVLSATDSWSRIISASTPPSMKNRNVE
jgi:hypothetical protein